MTPFPLNNSSISHTDKSNSYQIGEVIKIFRKLNNLTQIELGKMIGISAQQIHKYETGHNNISYRQVLQLAGILNIPSSYLFNEDKISEKKEDEDKSVTKERIKFLLDISEKLEGKSKEDMTKIGSVIDAMLR